MSSEQGGADLEAGLLTAQRNTSPSNSGADFATAVAVEATNQVTANSAPNIPPYVPRFRPSNIPQNQRYIHCGQHTYHNVQLTKGREGIRIYQRLLLAIRI